MDEITINITVPGPGTWACKDGKCYPQLGSVVLETQFSDGTWHFHSVMPYFAYHKVMYRIVNSNGGAGFNHRYALVAVEAGDKACWSNSRGEYDSSLVGDVQWFYWFIPENDGDVFGDVGLTNYEKDWLYPLIADVRYFQRVVLQYETIGKFMEPLSDDRFSEFFTEAEAELERQKRMLNGPNRDSRNSRLKRFVQHLWDKVGFLQLVDFNQRQGLIPRG